jgi:threonine dehydrogenase-like Zn-dependent dehydrogenase
VRADGARLLVALEIAIPERESLLLRWLHDPSFVVGGRACEVAKLCASTRDLDQVLDGGTVDAAIVSSQLNAMGAASLGAARLPRRSAWCYNHGCRTVRGLVFIGNRQVELRDFPDPVPGPGEVVVRIRSSGLCGSDLRSYRMDQSQTAIGGHEPCGELSFEEGAAIACGTGTAYMVLKKLDVSGRDTLAIYGQGPVGLSATQLGKAMGARVIAIDIAAASLEHGRRLGADVTVNPTECDPVERVRELTRAEGADATLDCTGSATARAQTVRSARVFGRACFVGEGGTVQLEPSPDIIHRHLTLYGSWTFSTLGLEECARFIVDRQVPLDRLITHRFRLDQGDEAFQEFDKGETGKCVFVL